MIDRNPVECDSCETKEQSHAPHCAQQDASSAESINNHQVDPGKEEVRGGNDRSDGNRIGKTDKSEQSRRIVHKTVETSKLADCHETAGCDESSEITWDNVELLEEPKISLAFFDGFCLRNVSRDMLDLLLNLLGSSVRED